MAPMKRPLAGGSQGYYEGTWSLREAARRLRISEKDLRRLLATGQLDFVQIAGQIRVPTEYVQQRMTRSDWPASVGRRVRPR